MKYKISNIKYQLSILVAAVFFATPLWSQVTVGDDQTPPHSFSLVEIVTSLEHSGGLRLPQLTTEERDKLSIDASDQTANGLVIYNLDTQCIEFWNNGEWVSMCSSSAKIVLGDLSRGGLEVDVTTDPFFSASASTLSLIPHDTPECSDANPYTASILSGSGYAHAVSVDASTGSFDLTMDANPSADERLAILRVTDKCTGNYRDFLLVQDGCSVPATPGTISGQKYASTDGMGVTYGIKAVSGATSYTWTLPAGWTGSSSGITILAKPGAQAQDGTISVTANTDCGSSAAMATDVKVVHGCGAMIDANTWKEFMCWNLGANYSADPFSPSAEMNGDYYQWGYKYPSGTYDVLLGTPVTSFEGVYPDPVAWNNNSPTPGVYGDGTFEVFSTTVKSSTDPCPAGYRIPNYNEWNGVITAANNSSKVITSGDYTGVVFGDALFLPEGGYRNFTDSSLSDFGNNGYYWSSTLGVSDKAYRAKISGGDASMMDNSSSAFGFSVRCIKE